VSRLIKLIGLINRKKGLSQEEFTRYWEKEHGPLIARVFPGVRRYAQNHPVQLPGGGQPHVDGVVELWFDDLNTFLKSSEFYLGDPGKIIRDDEDKFIDRSKMLFFVSEEKVIVQ
jgi:uncharacterized protein (TIGR02118 family)